MEEEQLLEELRKLEATWRQTKLRTPLKTMLLKQKAKTFAEVARRNARLYEAVVAFYAKKHWESPEFYHALACAATMTTIKLKVPETLLKHDEAVSLITTDPYGVVRVDRGPNVEQKFYSIVLSRQKEFKELRSKQLPYYVHIQGNRVRTTTSSTTAAELSRSNRTLHILQRYVPPLSSKISKMRVYWGRNLKPTSYSVISKNDLYQSGNIDPEVRNEPYSVFARQLASSGLKPHSSFQLERTSTPSVTRHRLSISMDKTAASQSSQRRRSVAKRRVQSDVSIADSTSAWVVHSSDLKNAAILENKSLTMSLLGTLNGVKKVAEGYLLKEPFTELLVDFMKDTDGRWILLTCKGIYPKEHLLIPNSPSPLFETRPISAEIATAEAVEDKPQRTFKSFYRLEGDEAKQFDEFKEELEAKSKLATRSMPFFDLREVKQEGIRQYGALMKRTKSGRIPKRIISMTPAKGGSITIAGNHKACLNLPPPKLQGRERGVASIMDKLTRQMDTSLENARCGARNLKVSETLSFLKSHKSLSIMRAFETAFLLIKEHKVLRRYLDPYPDADLHVMAMHAYPVILYNYKGGMSRKEVALVHHKLKLSSELYDCFTTFLLGCLKMEGFKEDHVDIIAQRLESLRPMIVSPAQVGKTCSRDSF
jgi:hypothetical protein